MAASNFTLDITKFVNKTKAKLDDVVINITFKLWEGVDKLSPVGNPSLWVWPAPPGYVGGHFRRNNQIEINTIPSSVKIGEDPTGSIILGENQLVFSSIRAGQRIFIVNPVPYGPVLEKGRHLDANGVIRGSTQAPVGIYHVVFNDFSNYLNEVVSNL